MICRCMVFIACVTATAVAQAQESAGTGETKKIQLIPEITVIESSIGRDTTDITPGASAAPIPDSMEILTRLPGANVNRNGPLSGQAQYRGLFGPRMTVTVDGMRVTPGGPNWMDSPLHYMPAGLTRSVSLTRGVAPVSAGPGMGGLIQAESKRSEFTSDHEFATLGDLTTSIMSNDGYGLYGLAGSANVKHRFHLLGSVEEGDDIESGDGTIGATEYDRTTIGAGYGYRWGFNDFSIDFSRTDTDGTGTPSLPLDIDFFETDRINLGLNTRWSSIDLSMRVFYTDIEHGMNNFKLRTAPDFSSAPLPPFQGDDKRLVDVETDALGFSVEATFGAFGGDFTVGLDGNFEAHDAVVTDPDFDPFFVTNFNDATQDQVAFFAEWLANLADKWSVETGLRLARVESDAGPVDAFPARLADMGMPPAGTMPGMATRSAQVLRDRFNAADRSQDDNNVDAVLKLNYEISEDLLLGFGYAHKLRSPLYIERYLWIPLEVNAGLGDFNNYIGDVGLDPEESDQVELSMEWAFQRGRIAPRIFYRKVDDYIQGVPVTDADVIRFSTVNGDPTPLQFANVEARLYGFDVVGRLRLADPLMLNATINYVRGKRDDISDDLYRIAPLNGRLSLTYERDNWSATVESVLVAEQDKISKTIVFDEPRSSNADTPGYGLVNLYGEWRSRNGYQVRAGIENLFDREYANHLNSFNRVINSDVPVGTRLPGPGINAFAQFAYTW